MIKNKKKYILYIITASAILAAIVLLYLLVRADRPEGGITKSTQNTSNQYSPPTEEEKQQAQDNKERISNNKSANPGSNDNPALVKPTIVSAYNDSQEVTVSAFVSGVFEDGGICKYIFTNSSDSFSKLSIGFKNVKTTSCPPVSVPVSEFNTKGLWGVVVDYTSSYASGRSSESSFRIE